MADPNMAERIARLKQNAAQVQQMSATAHSAIEFARQQLTQIDEELKKAGVNPENAEVEVAALEGQLAQTVADLETQLERERAELMQILDLAKQAQLIRA